MQKLTGKLIPLPGKELPMEGQKTQHSSLLTQEKIKETRERRRRRNQRGLWEEMRHNVLKSVIINKCFPISAKQPEPGARFALY